jgi:4-amino-4-deoxy-L-arabinose transferase-like glycosyltransferase
MNKRTYCLIAGILLVFSFLLAFFSMKGISLTMDELAHIPAGFSYLYARDFRLNPEHPPVLKDLAALPLMFLNLNFPGNHPSWQTGVNNQWWFGNQFIFKSGNNPDQIMFWARIPMILLMLVFCWFIFFFAKQLVGKRFALIALTFAVFSPTILAHGRLVTTDIGAAFGVILATYFWLKFLKNPQWKNVIVAGIILGFVLLLKFSLILLIPFFGILTVLYPLLKEKGLKSVLRYSGLASLAGIFGVVFIIWPIYYFHTVGYPQARQIADTQEILASNPYGPLKNLCIWMAHNRFLRPLAHYLLGLLMATQRVSAGNTVYFLGKVSGIGWKYYFPVVYLLKVPLAFHLLTLSILLFLLSKTKYSLRGAYQRTKNWILNNFEIFALILFVIIYWVTSISGNLNIGVRHVLPVFPCMYIIIAFALKKIFEQLKGKKEKTIASAIVSVLLIWYVLSSLFAFPHYLSYFNELAGGSKNGYKYVVDSNYDWGQDLKRLTKFVEDNKIEKIKVDYFGGDDVGYRLGEKWVRFDPTQGPQTGWIAVSATLLQGGRGIPVKGFDQPTGYYRWLDNYQPVTRAGNSIFVYYVE